MVLSQAVSVCQAAEARFKQAATAYQVLSDPALRKKYDEHGEEGVAEAEAGFVDSGMLFALIFGCEVRQCLCLVSPLPS